MIPKKKNISKGKSPLSFEAMQNFISLQDFYHNIGSHILTYLSQKRNTTVTLGDTLCYLNLDENCN